MKRSITTQLGQWAESPFRKPLLIRGARQIGKTYVVEDFVASTPKFDACVTVNFELEPGYRGCFETLQPDQIVNAIRLMKGVAITPGKTVLFLDEIQDCPNAIESLRYFKEQMPELHVIAAGSLLEFVLNKEEISMPVGRVDYAYMSPCTFEEFLWNAGFEGLVDALQTVTVETPLPSGVHDKLLQLFREFLVVGGMPEAMDRYLKTKDLYEVQRVQNSILQTYRDDFGKYARRTNHLLLQQVYDKAPGLVGHQISYVKVDPDFRSREIKVAAQMLEYAGLLRQVYATSAVGLPLDATCNEKKFKWYFLDVGLLQRRMGLSTSVLMSEDLVALNAGSVAEQVVAQELVAYQDVFTKAKLHFWQRDARNSQAEVDFVVQCEGHIIPIEVKSGEVGRLKSLTMLMQEKQLSRGVKISMAPLKQEGAILHLPLYMIKQLPRLLGLP